MHSFNSIFVHCVWSTKRREPFLTSELRDRLWPYLGGIARENKMKALAIGGAKDHVHILISLPGTLSISKAVQLLKGNSSKWITRHFQSSVRFNVTWVIAHSASGFSLWMPGSRTSETNRTSSDTHLSRGIRAMLRRHGFDYDERMLD